jgi:dTDP-4-amino-4,6-dideoxygalactose transaminase
VVRARETGASRAAGQPPRAALQASLAASGIETLIHYPRPIPKQPALAATRPGACPVAERACADVLSLPLHPGLREADVDTVAEAILRESARLFRKD